ncbi:MULTISPECIES: hypothetical protein [Lysinibacillus]|uniref:hypothetical protein n=1 Tax=Lysinibacillus TaxID=400634 RepID=UPI00289DA7CD|nr:hypothetical protein [Lysinibacillus boronitolerans]
MEIRERDKYGNLKPPTKIFSGPTEKETIAALGPQLAQEKLDNMQRDIVINGLGAQLARMKIEIMQLKGGAF